jgi:hypothetical protein
MTRSLEGRASSRPEPGQLAKLTGQRRRNRHFQNSSWAAADPWSDLLCTKSLGGGSVMPAKAGIQGGRWGSSLDSGVRRNDEWGDRFILVQSRSDPSTNSRHSRHVAFTAAILAAALAIGAHCAAAAAPSDRTLQRLLPAKVAGYVAGKPEGSTLAVAGLTRAQASRTYYRGHMHAAETVTVRIDDSGEDQFVPQKPDPATAVDSDGTSDVTKSFALDGYPALLSYDEASRHGSLVVFVGGRFLVEIESHGLDRSVLQQWWKRIDAKRLAKLQHGA